MKPTLRGADPPCCSLKAMEWSLGGGGFVQGPSLLALGVGLENLIWFSNFQSWSKHCLEPEMFSIVFLLHINLLSWRQVCFGQHLLRHLQVLLPGVTGCPF